ncbi:MAG: formylglycine-generating enzyme family protein [Gemmatimonadota bacterium]|nr:formylglycine-generating enzyme family protein [Gemmatimonadota bacterium]
MGTWEDWALGVLRRADFVHYNITMHTYLKIGSSLLLTVLLGLLACGDRRTAPTGVEEASSVVLLTAKVDAEVAARLVQVEVTVTAADMPAMRQPLAVDGDRIVGTVSEIPAGAARLFTVTGYDATGALVTSGSAKLDLAPGQSVPLGLTLVIEPSLSRSQPSIIVELAPGVPLDMVWIEPGVFTMGSPLDEQGRNDDEGPPLEVRLTGGFYLSQCEITQRQWTAVTGEQPWSHYADEVEDEPDRPAVYISWEDVQEFIAALNAAAGGQVYRLPTEAEWEYAGRAGTKTPWSFGDVETDLDLHAWWTDNISLTGRMAAQPVGLKVPNPWGLYDMHGNVWEWVGDWLGAYPEGPQTDPQGPIEGTARVFRGGSFKDAAALSRSAQRCWNAPDLRFSHVGVRLVRDSDS